MAELLGHKSLSALELMTDPTTVADAVATLTPGQIYWYKGKQYLYVKVVDLETVVGWSVELASADGMDVSGDRADASSLGRFFGGIAQAVVPVNSYGLFQIKGLGAVALLTDESIAAGDLLMMHATTNGAADAGTDGTNNGSCFGRAMAADAAAVLAAGAYYLGIGH